MLFPPVPWLFPQMSHSSDSFKDNAQISISVPRTQRHNPCLKSLQMILPSCSWNSSCYTTLPKRTQHSTVTKSKTRTFFCFFFYFRIQKLSKVYTIFKAADGYTCFEFRICSHGSMLTACRSSFTKLRTSEQGSTPTKRTISFVLLGNIKHVYLVSAHRRALQYSPHEKIYLI